MALTTVDQGLLGTYAQYTGFKNRIINGDMRIDQRNNGAAVTVNAGGAIYTVDRFAVVRSNSGTYTAQQSSTAPVGFVNSLVLTNNNAGTPAAGEFNFIFHKIEGSNVSDLGWGTANAQSVTVSFSVRASATGTYSGSVRNSAGTRSYPFTFAVNAANTFEAKNVVIPGDTAGTWLTNNGTGLELDFDLGSGSTFRGTAGAWAAGNFVGATGASQNMITAASATFYITGVQLEAGSTATSFDYRDYGRELMMCQRYYYQASPLRGIGIGLNTTVARVKAPLPVTMRATPTLTRIGAPNLYNGSVVASLTSVGSNFASVDCIEFDGATSASFASGTCVSFFNNFDGATVAASAEL